MPFRGDLRSIVLMLSIVHPALSTGNNFVLVVVFVVFVSESVAKFKLDCSSGRKRTHTDPGLRTFRS